MSFQSLNTEFDSAYELYTDKSQKPLEVVVCLRCGRPLTNEKSRLACLGPKCARKLAYETHSHSFSAKTLKNHNKVLKLSTQVESIPTQDISLYYSSGSSKKPYCKIGTVVVSAIESSTSDRYGYRKRLYHLPLFEGIVYEIFQQLPEQRVVWLQVHNNRLIDSSNFLPL